MGVCESFVFRGEGKRERILTTTVGKGVTRAWKKSIRAGMRAFFGKEEDRSGRKAKSYRTSEKKSFKAEPRSARKKRGERPRMEEKKKKSSLFTGIFQEGPIQALKKRGGHFRRRSIKRRLEEKGGMNVSSRQKRKHDDHHRGRKKKKPGN